MPTINFNVTETARKKTVDAAAGEEFIYDIQVTGAQTLTISYTPTEVGWAVERMHHKMSRLIAQISEDSNRLQPKDTSAAQQGIMDTQLELELMKFARKLLPGGGLV